MRGNAKRTRWTAGLGCVVGLCTVGIAWSAEASPGSAPAFDVLEFRVLGNTVLDTRSVETAIYPFTGPAKHMADVEAARAALERAYHQQGFGTVFVDIPEQTVDEGIVRLHVMEGRLNQTRLQGARYFSGREIRAALPDAKPDTVPNLPALEREVNAVNAETRDRVVVPVLKSGSEPGTVDLALRVDDHLPLHGSVELNNQYTADTSPLRALTALSYDNLFGRFDSLSLQFQVAPQSPQQSHVIAGSYTTHIGGDGSTLSFHYLDSKSDVATFGTLGVLGTGTVTGLQFIAPLGGASGAVQTLAVGIDYKDFTQNVALSSTAALDTPVNYINLSAAYTGLRSGSRLQFDWSTTLNFGLRNVHGDEAQFADKRFAAHPNYFYVRADGGISASLPWHFGLGLRLTGQYAVDPLVSNEQFAVGGAASVRGYLEAEELGDLGARASVQLNLPPLSVALGRVRLTEFMFYDAARVSTILALPGEAPNAELRSWGAGLRLQVFGRFEGDFTWADPLLSGTHTPSGASRFLFSARSTW
jgi:hemolysin activation/secretion protein